MKTLWDLYHEEIKQAECAFCQSNDDLYQFDLDLICRKCLENTEVDEHD